MTSDVGVCFTKKLFKSISIIIITDHILLFSTSMHCVLSVCIVCK